MNDALSHFNSSSFSKMHSKQIAPLGRDEGMITECSSTQKHEELHFNHHLKRHVSTKDGHNFGFKRSMENTSRISIIIDDIIEFEKEFYQWQFVPKSDQTESVSRLLAGLSSR